MNEALLKQKVDGLVADMTVEEKASLCSGADFWNLKGVDRLGIPSIMITDGPHGLRKQSGSADHVGLNDSVPATCFPTASALASSWDTGLMDEIGRALGEECIKENVAVLLGPGVNIKRSPLCGRNFEYFSEDPFQGGMMAAALAAGVQSKGVGTSVKHFAVNNQEKRRMTVDAVVDERAVREIYLPGFEKVVKEVQPHTVMNAYNLLNGVYCSENRWLLTDILRNEWGFKGLVVTDWGANNDRVKGLAAGQELEMPASGGLTDAKIAAAVMDGSLDEGILDRAARRLLTLILRNSDNLKTGDREACDMEVHHRLARKAESRSAVLLKNDGILPLPEGKSVAVIGAFAETPRYQGSGSSLINPWKLEGALEPMRSRFGSGSVTYAEGYHPMGTEPDDALIAEAERTAAGADIAVVFAGLPEVAESEGFDRNHLEMPDSHNALITAVAEANPETVVVLSNGAPVTMPWLYGVKAVLESYLGGQAWGPAVTDLLSGDVNPSGKLAETFPVSLDEDPAQPNFPGGGKSVFYAESLYVGYRFYETANRPVLFPFGYGLSYTSFEYSELEIFGPDADRKVTVNYRITNTGKHAGEEISQVYVRDAEAAVFRPEKELKAFTKTALASGESRTVSLELDGRSFAFWDKGRNGWCVEKGDFGILVGASSADIRLEGSVRFEEGDELSAEAADGDAAASDWRHPSRALFASAPADGRFAALIGREVPAAEKDPAEPFRINSTLGELKRRRLGRVMFRAIIRELRKQYGDDEKTMRMMEAMMEDMPLRNLMMMAGGGMTDAFNDGLLMVFNRRPLRGILKMIRERPRRGPRSG